MSPILTLLLLLFSSMSPLLSHPLSLGLILFIQTIIISLLTVFLNESAWYSYILFLIMVGGMLILFTYMTSIASNEKFIFNKKIMILFIIPMMTSPFIEWKISNNESSMFEKINYLNTSSVKFISTSSNILILITTLHLLLTLIAVVKISNFKKGTIRQMN